MTFPTTLVYDIAAVDGGARRPSLADVGGALLENKAGAAPPDTGTHLHADFCNQWERLLAAHGRTAGSAIITIDFAAGVPFIDKLQTLSANLTTTDFAVSDDGTGVTRIQWTSTKLPAPTCDPTGLTFAGSGLHQGSVVLTQNWSGAGAGASTPGTHRIIVTTYLSATEAVAASLANVRCSFQIN